MGQLEYDNSAFYYFMISMLSLYLVPGWYYATKYVLSAFIGGNESHRSELEKKKEAKLKTNQRGVEKLKNRTFLINVLALVTFSLLFVYLVFQVMSDSVISSFDPYHILSIDRSATDKQIKKAYKLKALEFHPDKNIGDRHAEQMFMMVAKAYEALTDPIAKENWEKFGNPDGKQSFEMSIGLPTFFMEKDNHNLILIGYLILMVIVVPTVVHAYYRDSQMYGEGNIMYKTYSNYASLLLGAGRPPVTKLKLLPEIFATAAEFEGVLAARDSDQESIKNYVAIFSRMNAAKTGGKKADSETGEFWAKPSKWLDDVRAASPPHYWRALKGNLVLHAHLGRAQLAAGATAGAPPLALGPDWAKALDAMLGHAPALVGALVAIAGDSKKFETTLEVMRFSQCLVQAVWPRGGLVRRDGAPFYQIPHMTPELNGAMMGKKGNTTLQAYLRLPFEVFAAKTLAAEPNLARDEVLDLWAKLGPKDHAAMALDNAYERPGLADLSDAQRADVEGVLRVLPDLEVECRHFVHDEEYVCERDTVTLEVKLTRRHVPEGAKAPPVHAPFFPVTKKAEEWWVVLKADEPRFSPWDMLVEKVTDQGRVVTTELKFPAPPKTGKFGFTVSVVSDSYFGLDHTVPFTLQVESAAELPEPEDAYEGEDLETETALEATFGAGNVDSDVSDSEDEAEAAKPTAKAAASKAAAKKKKASGDEDTDAVVVEAGDSSSGEELD